MNQRIVAKYINELEKFKADGKTIGSPDVREFLDRVKVSFGIDSDELGVVAKAVDRIFKTDLKERS